MSDKNLHVINPTGYLELTKSADTKKVTLPSGAVFEIRKVTGRQSLAEMGSLGLKDISSYTSPDAKDRAKQLAAKVTPEERTKLVKLNDRLLVRAVVAPQLCLEPEANKLCVENLTDKDYYALLAEINMFSRGVTADSGSFPGKSQ